MATTVTITEAYINRDHFQGKVVPYYVYSGIPTPPVANIKWSGTTAGGVGTYVDSQTILSNSNLIFDGTVLHGASGFSADLGSLAIPFGSIYGSVVFASDFRAGGVTEYGAQTYGVTAGGTVANNTGGVEIIGNRAGSDASVGWLSFHNASATQADKKIAEISGYRYGDDDAGGIYTYVSDTNGTLQLAYVQTDGIHSWYISGANELNLSGSALYGSGAGSLDLGNAGSPFGTTYTQNARLATAAGTGNRLIYADADGDLLDAGNLVLSDPNTLTLPTVVATTVRIEDATVTITQDSAGNMVLTDGVTGAKTLAELDAGGMVYPGVGVAVSTGSAWDTSITASYLVLNNQANTYTAGMKQTMGASATTAGLSLAGYAGDPSAPTAGDIWYNTSTNRLMYRGASASREVVARTLAQTLTNKTIALGSNTVSGSMSQFDTALTDSNFLYDADFASAGLMYTNGAGTYSIVDHVWELDSGGNAVLVTPGTDIYLAGDGTERIYFGDTNAYIYKDGTHILHLVVDGSIDLDGTASFQHNAVPAGATQTVGTAASFWNEGYFNTLYIEDATVGISQDSGGNLVLTDGITGAKTLAELSSGAYTFSNGLTEFGGAVKWGGDQTENVVISNTSSFTTNFRSSNGTAASAGIWLVYNYAKLGSYNDSGWAGTSGFNEVTVTGAQVNLIHNNGTASKSITLSAGSMTVTDAQDSAGLYYAADYSAGATDRWIPDKAYVDAASTPSTSVQVSYTDCPDATTTNITIGAGASDVSFILHYVAERNMGTVQKQSGDIKVLYDDVSGTVYYGSSYIGPDLDFNITADLNAGNIRLNIVVGSVNTNNLLFDVTEISKFYE